MSVVEHKDLEKSREDIKRMFSSITPRYDLLNRLLSLGFDSLWRRKAANEATSNGASLVLDVCAGTLDLALSISEIESFKGTVIGADFCKSILAKGVDKLRKRKKRGRVKPLGADALQLPFKSGSFDAVTVAFGLRNINPLNKALKEMVRVIKKGGKVVILEFYRPDNRFLSLFYFVYLKYFLPLIGKAISGHDCAYSYFRDSVVGFISQDEMKVLMEKAGLNDVKYEDLTFGVTTIHSGVK